MTAYNISVEELKQFLNELPKDCKEINVTIDLLNNDLVIHPVKIDPPKEGRVDFNNLGDLI